MGINVASGSLGAVVRSYKAAVTRRINRWQRLGAPQIWQRGYYEHIVRDEHAMRTIRRYITENPERHAARFDTLLARMELCS